MDNKKLSQSDIDKIISDNWLKLTNKEIGKLCGANSEKIRRRGQRLGLPNKHNLTGIHAEKEFPIDNKDIILEDLTKRKENAKFKELESKYKYLLEEYELSEKRLDTLLNIQEEPKIVNIQPKLSIKKNEAVPIIQLSDWHFEERVDANTINNLNEYNLNIATIRWDKCIQNSLKLVNKERQSSSIRELCLWLGGDFISGYIHEELEENNYLSPVEATMFSQDKIISAIEFYLKEGDFDKITIPCNFGNHGRTNKKPRVSTGYKNSYEWMMYKMLQKKYEKNKKINFIVPNGMFTYVTIYNFVSRFFHGDSIKYGGGIGGLTVPLIKAIQRYDQQQQADYNFMGHFHQLWQATRNCIVNGSGIGFSPYAQRIGASPEEPMQSFSLIDKKYGLTIKTPIFCK
jgi:hypothetical protein